MAEAIGAVGTQGQSDTLTSYDAAGRVSQSRDADGLGDDLRLQPGWAADAGQRRPGRGGAVGLRPGGPGDGLAHALGQWGNSAYNAVGKVTQSTDAWAT